MLKRRYCALCIWCCSNTTHEACVASPAVWLMSKHSMRNCAGSAMSRSSASTSARVRCCCEPSSAKQSRQCELGTLGRHLQPDAALFARLVLGTHAHVGGFAQRLQQSRVHRMAGDSCGGTAWPM
jgi:hypothetical protein